MNFDKRIKKLSTLFGRKIDLKIESQNNYSPKMITVRFPVSKTGFLNDNIIILTIGMSDEIDDNEFEKIELAALVYPEYQNEPEADFIVSIINWMAHFSYREQAIFEHGQIFEWGNPFINSCELENLYFSHFPFNEVYQELKDILEVDSIFNLIPISNTERLFADKYGTIKLLQLFEKNELSPYFHFFRKPLL